MKKHILIAATLFLCITILQACNDGSTTKEITSDTSAHTDGMTHEAGTNSGHDQMMKQMEGHMNAVKMTGDFDLDFANMMIPHHQGAVDMAEKYLPTAKDEKIKTMALNIISSQKKEIEDLKSMIATHKPAEIKKEHSNGGHGADGHNELMDAMKAMMDKMKGMPMSGDADKDFVTMMIPHHQSAIDMAENQISHCKNVELKKFAQKVINDQSKEIKEFEAWLSSK